ncbi:glycosyltransferase family 61 protein [Labrys wisconsinensis]|uniref:Capsular polysaccharide biosynthesis protein n=1 Tax=Labrys wisconsinensis TaxID=425677 RepID=A0ABU0JF15_9HYPH|nr:glycosyltransferase 61 family protein [Labrys wisconsinensis]MDQ0472868.1 capsular polysaccharide biosynthesis protein [Labrys wisconsinensis]
MDISPKDEPSAHKLRIQQLTNDGLDGFYRSAEHLKTTIEPGEFVPPPKPMLGSIGCKKEFTRKHDRVTGHLNGSGFYSVDDCYIGKCGTLLDRERKVLWADDLVSAYWMWFLGKMITREVVIGNPVKPSAIGSFIGGSNAALREIDDDMPIVCLAKPGVRVYGHWILDTLPLVWNFFEAVKAGHIGKPYKFLVSSTTPRWALSFLNLLFGIGPDDIITYDDDKEILHLRHAIVPGLLRVSPLISRRMNDFVAYTLDVARHKAPEAFARTDLPERIFISRADFAADGNRLLLNHEAVTRAVVETGLVPMMPERLSWPEQLALFSKARIVSGEYGSGLHNAMFGGPDCISIVFASLKMNWTQSAIVGIRGQDSIYVQPSRQERTGTANGIIYEISPASIAQAVAIAGAEEARRAASGAHRLEAALS